MIPPRYTKVSERRSLKRISRDFCPVNWLYVMSGCRSKGEEGLLHSLAAADWKQRSPNRVDVCVIVSVGTSEERMRRRRLLWPAPTVASEVWWYQSVDHLVRQQYQLELSALPEGPVWCDRGNEFPTQGCIPHRLKASVWMNERNNERLYTQAVV